MYRTVTPDVTVVTQLLLQGNISMLLKYEFTLGAKKGVSCGQKAMAGCKYRGLTTTVYFKPST